MTEEIVYYHASGDSLSIDCNPKMIWQSDRAVEAQEALRGIARDSNNALRKVPINTYIDIDDVMSINQWMRPSTVDDYDATSALVGAVYYKNHVDVESENLTDANDAGANDMPLLPTADQEVGDAYYFGFPIPITALRINIGTAGVGTYTITWEYSQGSDTWEALSNVTDDTSGFTVAGLGDVSWTIPPDWATDQVGSYAGKYWVRARRSAHTSQTTDPTGTQAWCLGVYPYVVITWESGQTMTFPCMMLQPQVSKMTSKYSLSCTLQERTL